MNDRTQLAVIYCIKTGQPVGSMSAPYQYHPSAVAPDWFQTDGQYLDGLQEMKPRAYVAFCLGLIDNFWRSTCHRSKKRQEALEHHWSLVRAYDMLGAMPDHSLIELSHALCRFITYAPLSYRVLDQKLLTARRAADLMAESAVAGALLPALNKAIVRTLAHAENYAKAGASVKTPKYEIIPESIEDAAKGPSNIRAQKTSRDYHRNAKQNKLMADLLREFGGIMGWSTIPERRPGQSQASKLLGRISRQGSSIDNNSQLSVTDDFERDLLDELERHMSGGSFVPEYEESEDDTVEVRTIPRALVESMGAPAAKQGPEENPIVAPKPIVTMTTPAQSLLNRIKRS